MSDLNNCKICGNKAEKRTAWCRNCRAFFAQTVIYQKFYRCKKQGSCLDYFGKFFKRYQKWLSKNQASKT